MCTATEQISISERARIQDALTGQLTKRLSTVAKGAGPVILRAEVPVAGLDILSWLCAQNPTSRGYWCNRDEPFELAGVGSADMMSADSEPDYRRIMGTIHRRLAEARGNARYLGGMRFSGKRPPEPVWDHFRAYRFILPRFEVVRANGQTIFACHMFSNEDLGVIRQAFSAVAFPSNGPYDRLPAPVARHNSPDESRWISDVSTVLNALEAADYKKIVLARKATFTFSAPVDAAVLLRALKKGTPQCFHFLFQPHARTGFLGASPERLYRRDGDVLRTEAIAGSRSRGADPQEDQALSEDLLASDKDQREQRHVVDGIQKHLGPLCALLTRDEQPSVLKLARCQHLVTRFKGKLNQGVGDAQLLEHLHPTPAVGGVPRERALQDIAAIEPFDRGWYAGPVGWISKSAAQFVVGIRSGLTEGRHVHLFSGAGIVRGSVAEAEWQELEDKISDFVGLFPPIIQNSCATKR